MPVYLQRVRFSVHTKKQFLAGTNSPVSLGFEIEERHLHPKLPAGMHWTALDHPWHDDFQAGKADSYEVDFGTGRAGKSYQGIPILNGLQFETLDDVRDLNVVLKIDGSDQWIFDRCALGGFLVEVRKTGEGDYEEVELGWIELAKHSGDVSMSADPDEGYIEYPIELNGSFQ